MEEKRKPGNPNWIKKKEEREMEPQQPQEEVKTRYESREDREKQRLEAAKARREQRGNTGKLSRRLDYPKREGFERRWVNDAKGKVQRLLDRGWMFVEREPGVVRGEGDLTTEIGQSTDSRVSAIVTQASDGHPPVKAYLMEIPEQWREEDRKQMFDQIDKIEKDIQGGIDAQGMPGVDGRYIPKTPTSIEYGG